jgi:hypothetical protein
MTSANQPPVLEASGVTAGVSKTESHDFIVDLAFSLICPAGKPMPVSVVFSDPDEQVAEAMGKPCEGEWAAGPFGVANEEGDFQVWMMSGTPGPYGSQPELKFSPHWGKPGTYPFLYQVTGTAGLIAQAPLSVSIIPMRLIYRGNPEYPSKCVEPRQAARVTEPGASCLVAETVTYHRGWPPPPESKAPPSRVPKRHCAEVYWRTRRDGAQLCPATHSLVADLSLVRLRWSSWGSSTAKASGFIAHTVFPKNHLAYSLSPVSVRLSQPKRCPDGMRIYSRYDLITYTRRGHRRIGRDGYGIRCNGETGGGGGG